MRAVGHEKVLLEAGGDWDQTGDLTSRRCWYLDTFQEDINDLQGGAPPVMNGL